MLRRFKLIAAGLLAIAVALIYCLPAEAQLIVVSRQYRVVAVDASRNLIQVSNVEGTGSAGNVLVTPETRMYLFRKEIPNFAWHLLQPGMKITVKGGYTWDLKVKAKHIFL